MKKHNYTLAEMLEFLRYFLKRKLTASFFKIRKKYIFLKYDKKKLLRVGGEKLKIFISKEKQNLLKLTHIKNENLFKKKILRPF